MKRTRSQLGASLIVLTAAACLSGAAFADDKEATETRSLEEFEKVRVYGAFSGTIKAGQSHGIVLTGDKDLLQYVSTTVDGDTLKIKLKKSSIRRHAIKLNIGTMSLTEVRIDGAGNFDISDVDAEDFELNLPGASKLSVSGKCEDLEIRISGFASIEGKDFKCNSAMLKISGHGKISVYADTEIETRISGLGHIEVYGNPEEIEQKISGLGRVSFKDDED